MSLQWFRKYHIIELGYRGVWGLCPPEAVTFNEKIDQWNTSDPPPPPVPDEIHDPPHVILFSPPQYITKKNSDPPPPTEYNRPPPPVGNKWLVPKDPG